MEEIRNAYKILVAKPEGKSLFRKISHIKLKHKIENYIIILNVKSGFILIIQ
jgi:hypothetical protein